MTVLVAWIHFVSIYFYLYPITIQGAFIELTNSEEYKDIAKQRTSLGGKYRGYLSRFNGDKLKAGAIVEILVSNGYEVSANKAVKKGGVINTQVQR